MNENVVKALDERHIGFFMVENEVMDDYNLGEIEFYLYSKICRHSNQHKNCYFSLSKLKKKLKWGNSTVSAAIKSLTDKKLIRIEKVDGKGYRFFLLKVNKKTLPARGAVSGDPSPTGSTPSPGGSSTLPPTGDKEDLIKEETIKEDCQKPPKSDPQRSSSAEGTPGHEEAYGDIYKAPKPAPKETDVMKKYKDPFLREPNPKVEAAFKKLGSFQHIAGKSGNDDVADADPGVKYNCVDCGIMTEFKDKEEALEGNCRKCGQPIFKEVVK